MSQTHRVRLDLGEALPDWREYHLLVVMGGGMGVYEEDAYPWLVPFRSKPVKFGLGDWRKAGENGAARLD